ncbi:MAG: hypothetical protein R6X25_15805 [Candidatus Krumholzibacteriia bacterium]
MAAVVITELFRAYRDEIAERVASQLKSSSSPHYRQMSVPELAGRARRMVEVFVDSIGGAPGRLAAYLEDVADVRMQEGFFLGEMQGALNVLEETAWRLVVDHIVGEHQVEGLSRVTTVIGVAKDRLAQVYLERSLRAETEAVVLRRRLDALMSGTDSPAVDEADLD